MNIDSYYEIIKMVAGGTQKRTTKIRAICNILNTAYLDNTLGLPELEKLDRAVDDRLATLYKPRFIKGEENGSKD